jgi:hypothetical protein
MAKTPRGFNFGDRAIWETYRLGSFICFTNNIPFGTDVHTDNRENPVFDVSGWNPQNIDCEDWVDFTASVGGQYAIFTVMHNMGWSWYPFEADVATHTGKDSYNATITLPQVVKYGVNNPAIIGTADQDVVHRFVARCRTQGIKPVLYYNIGKDLNSRGGHSNIQAAAFATDPVIAAEYPAYCAMVEARMAELLTAFPDVWLWLDAPHWYPITMHQSLFNAIRAAGNENTLVIYNYDPVAGSTDGGVEKTKPTGTSTSYTGTLDGTQMYMWPFDVGSYEYSRLPTNAAIEMAVRQRNLKRYYWRGAEVSSPIYDGQWFYWDQAIVGGTPNVLSSAATLNARADLATDQAAPFALALSPDGDGIVDTAQKNRFTDVANHIFP